MSRNLFFPLVCLFVNIFSFSETYGQHTITAALHISDAESRQDITDVFFEGKGLTITELKGGNYQLRSNQSPVTAVLHRSGYTPYSLILRSDTVLNIAFEKAVTNLPAIIVHTRKLTAADILDSVLKYSSRNYLLLPAYKGRLSVSLISRDSKDTFFNRVVPVTLLRKGKKDDEYRMYTGPGAFTSVAGGISRVTKNQQLRLMDIAMFPQKSLSGFLRIQRNAVESQPVFFGTSISDSENFYHIIVRFDNKLRRSALAKQQSSDVNGDTTINFLSMIVGRSDWSLRMFKSNTISVEKALAQNFLKASTYTEIRDLIAESSRRYEARILGIVYQLKELTKGKYIPFRSEVEDNLLNFSRTLFKKAENPEASVYRYNLTIEIPLFEKPAGPLEKFYIFELL